jgi:cysteinyl-tRNA synthetase
LETTFFYYRQEMNEPRKREQPQWTQPQGTFITGLRVNNSLTKQKELFVPSNGKLVKMYICGPTVYDSAHLGHARNYLTFDIIRRILEDYFGYDIFLVMNITDIDDKIILRARRNYLFEKYKEEHRVVDAVVIEELKEAWAHYRKKLSEKLTEKNNVLQKLEKGNKKELENEILLLEEKLEEATKSENEVTSVTSGDISLIDRAKEPLSEMLDAKFGSKLDQNLIKELCRQHSQKYEQEFMDDMRALGVRTPDVLSRVSEYINEIIEFIKTIMANGYAYESNGSVYFDTVAFGNTSISKHHYAKLEPSAVGNLQLTMEGEGALSAGQDQREKRHPADFALWKKSKPGEPAWESPWGLGRPGWHIECSTMAGTLLGNTLDIHGGGVDLKFPHHDNELAQSEAYFNNNQWVNYFLHAGHLHIDGLKMSKSLKNFITIREVLASDASSASTNNNNNNSSSSNRSSQTESPKYSARQLRFLFLLQPWDHTMNYQRENTMADVSTKEKYFSEFFIAVDNVLQERKFTNKTEAWNGLDVELHKFLLEKQKLIHESLLDNFNTAAVINHLVELVNRANIYLQNNSERKGFLLKKIAVYITKILRVFGLVDHAKEFGFRTTESVTAGTQNREEILRPYVEAFNKYRNQIRAAVKEKKSMQELLEISDKFRDEDMVELGVRITDDNEFPIAFVDKNELIKEREERRRQRIQNELKAKQKRMEQKRRQLDDYMKWSTSPEEYISKIYNVTYNGEGDVPKKDRNGQDISKNTQKKIKSEFQKQQENHQKYISKLKEDSQFLEKLKAEIETLARELSSFP